LIFVHHVVELANVDDQGRFAAGGPVNITSYAVGDKLPAKYKTEDTVVVGGDLTYLGGEVFEGNIVYGGTGDIRGVTHFGKIEHKKDVIDFDMEFQILEELSKNISMSTANGRVIHENKNVITLQGSQKVNIFKLTMNSNITQMTITCPEGSWALVNVLGEGRFKDLQITLKGVNQSQVLYNMRQSEVVLTGVSVEGSVLAPYARIEFTNGNVQGQVICDNLYGNGEVHYFPFIPIPGKCPPCPPCPPKPPTMGPRH